MGIDTMATCAVSTILTILIIARATPVLTLRAREVVLPGQDGSHLLIVCADCREHRGDVLTWACCEEECCLSGAGRFCFVVRDR